MWKILVFLNFYFHATVGLFPIYELECFSYNQLPYLLLFYFSSLIRAFSPFFLSLFAVVVVAFWQNSPHNCRCNALSASLEVIMRSVCFCEDNRESQRILSCFPDGRVREGVERAFVCMEADRQRQIWKHKVMSPLNIPQQAYFSCDIHLDNKMDMNYKHLLLLLFFPLSCTSDKRILAAVKSSISQLSAL